MTSVPRRRLEQISTHLLAPDQGTFEDIPKIRSVAGDSVGPYGNFSMGTANSFRRVKDKVIIVTGANSPLGIGRAAAHQFAHNGAKAVYICDYADDHLETHKREINKLYPGVEIHVKQFDAADASKVEAVVSDAMQRYGRLDVYFANAGIVGQPTIFTSIESDDFMETLRVNVLSVFLAAKFAAPAMKVTSQAKPIPNGSIISTASVAGIRSNAGSTDYSASKAAVVSIMQTTAWQLAGSNIRCNAICPGIIETGMTAPMYEMARERGTENKIGQLNPSRRGAVADEVARVALFLGSDEASYINGQAIPVCGGLTAGHPVVPGKIG